MKKILSLLLVLVFCFGCFAACGSDEDTGDQPSAEATLADAVTYLQTLYKDAAESTPRDYDMPAKVMIGTTSFTVTWTVSVDTVTVKESTKAGFVTIDLPDVNETEFKYVLTATVKDADGKTQDISFNRKMPVVENPGTNNPEADKEYKLFMTQVTVGKVLYAITETQDDKYLKTTDDITKAAIFKTEAEGDGFKIYTEIDGVKNYIYAHTVPYDDGSGKMSKYLCYSAENASVWTYQQNVNAWFTTCADGTTYVMGTYSNFETFCISEATFITAENTGVTQFPAELLENGKDAPNLPKPDANDPAPDSTLTVKQAIDLGASKISDQYTTGKYYVTGVITEVYNEQYGNMRITDSEGNILTIYGTYSADGSARYDAMTVKPVAGDTVKVYGIIGQYKDDPQMKNGWIVENTPAEGNKQPDPPQTNTPENPGTPALKTPADIVNAAWALAPGATLGEYTLTGVITSVDDAYSEQYKNVTVTIVVDNMTDKPIVVYRAKGDGADVIAVGDTITVTGTLLNYLSSSAAAGDPGKVEFTSGCTIDSFTKAEGGNNNQPATPTNSVVTTPKAGVAYKFGMVQGNLQNKLYYLKGGMAQTYYLATSEDVAEAIDVYLEETNGGYYLYTMVNGAKTYINMVVSGTHVNGVYEATASTVYTWSAEKNTVISVVNDADYWFGTRNDNTYTTVGPVKVEYDGFYCQFYA